MIEQPQAENTEVTKPQQNPVSPGDAATTDVAEHVSSPVNSFIVEQRQPRPA
jgi:hypothetical protein